MVVRKIKFKRGLESSLPLLEDGEPAICSNGRFYIGTPTGNVNINSGSDIPSWAKQPTKPSYNKSEVGLSLVDNTSDVNKNVLSATKLTNARTINGVPFDGTQNITLDLGGGGTSLFSKGFEVRTEAPTGDDLYEGRCWIIGTPPAIPVAPVATNVSFSGTVKDGQVVTGHYTYSDADGDLEGTSTFQWYLGTASNGSDKVAINGETNNTYTIQVADVGKYLFFEVTPVALTGITQGSPSISSSTLVTSSVVPNTAPTAPNIGLSSVNATSITIEVVSGATDTEDGVITKYNTYVGGVLHDSDVTIAQGGTFQVSGLASSTQFTVTLKAKDSNGALSVASNGVTVTTSVANTAPTVPTGLASSNITNIGFTLSWNTSIDAQDNPITYKVYKDGTLYQSGVTATNLVITGQQASSTSIWKVSATDGSLESAQSTGLSVTTTVAPLHEYLMNESSGVSVYDTGVGTIYIGSASGTTIVTGLGGSAYARKGNGTTDIVTFTNQIIPLGAKTIKFLMKRNGLPTATEMPMSNGGHASPKNGTSVWIKTDGTLAFVSTKGDGIRFLVNPTTNVCDNAEHVVKCTWDGTTNANAVKVYIDDMVTPKATGTAAITETVNATDNLTMFDTTDRLNPYGGILDSVQFFSSVV